MSLPLTVPKSALDKYIPIKLISQSANGCIFASVRKNDTKPTLSSPLALKIPPPNDDREALLGRLESLRDFDSRRITKVIDYDSRGNWYITPLYLGQSLQHLKETLFGDGFPPFLICRIFVEVIAAQGNELGPKGVCHADLRGSNIILSPTTKEELPYVRIVHLEGIAVWHEQAIFRTSNKGGRLENSSHRSLADGDGFYSFIANYDLEGQKSWKGLKREWTNMAAGLMYELYDIGRLADVKEVIEEQQIPNEELRQAVKDGGMDVIDDRDL